MGIVEAMEHVPQVPTYAIRIQHANPDAFDLRIFGNLNSNPLYRHIHEYRFDDCSPSEVGRGKALEDETAAQIIRDFESGRRNCENLLVHCTRGKNRSPAVAIALNEIFNLGESTENMKQQYPKYTTHTYQTLTRIAPLLLKS